MFAIALNLRVLVNQTIKSYESKFISAKRASDFRLRKEDSGRIIMIYFNLKLRIQNGITFFTHFK